VAFEFFRDVCADLATQDYITGRTASIAELVLRQSKSYNDNNERTEYIRVRGVEYLL
jgi:hypothetical protein